MSSQATVDTTTSRFSIHGVGLSFTTNSLAIMNPVDHHLQYFQEEDPASLSLYMAFDAVESRDEIPVRISSSAHQLFSRTEESAHTIPWTEWPCEIFLDQGRVIADFQGRGLMVIDGCRGQAHGFLVQPETWPTDLCVRFVHAGFMELLKYRGMYTTHATALEKNGHGILMSGQSGRGKTTSFLSLLRSGYRCVSDDHPFLRSNDHEIEALGFPVKVDVTNNTVKLFPELQEAGPLLHQGRYKKYFYVEDLYSWGVAEVCRPRILLFPHVVDSPTSRLELLSKAQALENLLPQGLLVYDRNIAKQEFQTLTRLVEQVDSYQLHFGHDVLNLPQLINPLLEVA